MDGLHIKRAFAGSPYARFPGFEPLTSPEVQLLRLPDDDVSSVDGIGSPAQKLVSPYIRPSCEALKSFGTYENWKKEEQETATETEPFPSAKWLPIAAHVTSPVVAAYSISFA